MSRSDADQLFKEFIINKLMPLGDTDLIKWSMVKADNLALATVYEILFDIIVTGDHPPFFPEDRKKLITAGYCVYVDASRQKIGLHMIEGTPQGHLSRNLGNHEQQSPVDMARFMRLRTSRPYHPGSYLVWYFTRVFVFIKPGVHVQPKHVFQFPMSEKKRPTWTDTAAQLVTFRKNSQGVVLHEPMTEKSASKKAAPWAFRAETEEDVRSWLGHEKKKAFCICPLQSMAHLIFALKTEDETVVWVFLRFSPELTQDGLNQDAARFMRDELFVPKHGDRPARNPDEAVRAIIPGAQNHTILRIIMTFDEELKSPYVWSKQVSSSFSGESPQPSSEPSVRPSDLGPAFPAILPTRLFNNFRKTMDLYPGLFNRIMSMVERRRRGMKEIWEKQEALGRQYRE